MGTILQVIVDKDYYSDIGNDDQSICERYPPVFDTFLNRNKVNYNYVVSVHTVAVYLHYNSFTN